MAASVFPTPVGAIRSTFDPESITGQVEDWASVGSERPLLSNAAKSLVFIFITLNQLNFLIHQSPILLKFPLLLWPSLPDHFSK